MGGMDGYGDLKYILNFWRPPQHYRLEEFCRERKGSYEKNFLKGVPKQTKKIKKGKGGKRR